MDNLHDDPTFAPLTPEDHAIAVQLAPPAVDDGDLVFPVPDDAPARPKNHFKLGEPTACWEYRDAAGAPLLYVSRFDPPEKRKEFLPQTVWRPVEGSLKWCWKNVPSPRPLYSLDRLAAHPDAPAVVCEGEKSADAAAAIFPKSVGTTSLGGCASASKAEWTPLAGRRVLLWPDADEAGTKYASDVAHILHGFGCELSIIDAMALASMTPDGGTREPVKGWDAANAINEWSDLAALRNAAFGHAKPFAAGPSYVSYGDFKMDKGGLTIEVEKGRGEEKTKETLWICSPFEIIGACRDPNSRAWPD
jgi:putative DNA primase/helicase